MAVRDAKEPTVCIKACRLAMEFFEISKAFPLEERFALVLRPMHERPESP